MATSFLPASNPILTRELRAGLRNARAFGLIALYVAILGAVVTANFPGDQTVDIRPSSARGQDLFWLLVGAQIALVLTILPALATGALAQERERQTLQPLLLTPLSPLQIVWGKAGGVLSLVGLLLLATLPLTSLCFLLGGVPPGMMIAAYAAIFGLAIFTTGFGLYCSARWSSATRALLSCYALLPVVISLVVVALPLGALFSGLFCLFLLFYALVQALQKGAEAPLAKRLGRVYGSAIYVVAPLVFGGLLWLMWFDRNIGLIVVGVGFILSYFVMATQWGLLQTARELMVRADPEESMRQKVADFKDDWKAAAAPPVYLPGSAPAPTPSTSTSTLSAGADAGAITAQNSEWAPLETTQSPAAPEAQVSPEPVPRAPVLPAAKNPTYGVTPFLSDKMNPIYARELRSGLLGQFEYLFRFGYGISLLSEVGLLLFLLAGLWNPDWMRADLMGPFVWWGRVHLGLLMIFGAWFGARAIAPEREGQTLAQLFTIPMPARQIIAGKMAAVLTFTLYVWVLAVPLALLCGMLDLVPWPAAVHFVVVEAILGTTAAAWGLYCSFHSNTVRRALATSLGGVAALLLAHALVFPIWDLLKTLQLVKGNAGAALWASIFPIPLLFPRSSDGITALMTGVAGVSSRWSLPALAGYVALTALLLWLTARDFGRLARET